MAKPKWNRTYVFLSLQITFNLHATLDSRPGPQSTPKDTLLLKHPEQVSNLLFSKEELLNSWQRLVWSNPSLSYTQHVPTCGWQYQHTSHSISYCQPVAQSFLVFCFILLLFYPLSYPSISTPSLCCLKVTACSSPCNLHPQSTFHAQGCFSSYHSIYSFSVSFLRIHLLMLSRGSSRLLLLSSSLCRVYL